MSNHLPPDGIRSAQMCPINNSTNDTINPVNDSNQLDDDTMIQPECAGSTNSNTHSIFAPSDQISSKSQNRLLPGNMLDDELINLRLLHLQSQETKDGVSKAPKTHYCNSHFFSKLYNHEGYNFDRVKSWISETKLPYRLVDCKMIVLPIFQKRGHWVLIVLNVTEKLIEYCDSLGHESYEKEINVCSSLLPNLPLIQIVFFNRS
jgi:Ulp1 family protease